MRKIIATGIVGIFVLMCFAGAASAINISKIEENSMEKEKLLEIASQGADINDITLEDDAFHKTNSIYHIETWYFDAVFSNEYSMAVIVSVLQKDNIGKVLTGLYIYKDTELIYRPRTFHSLDQLSFSEEKLDMKISDETIMKCDVKSNGRWKYHVSEDFDDVSVNLNFVNMTDGWKVNITGGWWLVSPRLKVSGSLTIEGQTISVSGEGYHDHNWFYVNTPLMQEGWHFGNIAGDSLGITWANIMKDGDIGDSITVLNQKNANPISISPDNVKLTVEEYVVNNDKKIPKIFSLKVDSDQVKANFNVETLNFNYVELPLLSYWRFHLRIVGTITLGEVTEKIDNIGISELMKFAKVDISRGKNTENNRISNLKDLFRSDLFNRLSNLKSLLFERLLKF